MGILLISGEPDAEALRDALAATGQPCALFTSGEETMDAALDLERPLVAVISLELPGMDGLDTLRSLRCLQSMDKVPVVMLAAAPSEAQQIAAYDMGIEDILSTPVSPKVLEAKLDSLLRRARRAREIDPHPGMLLDGRYRVLRQLGRGGMGTVYLVEPRGSAAQADHPEQLALKLFHAEDSQIDGQHERFLREVQTLACLEHPNLIRVHDWGMLDERGFYVMDYLDGGSLGDELEKTQLLRPNRALAMMAKIADGIHHAHKHDLLHRDIKPDNVLYNDAGEPIVTDFGLVIDAADRKRRITESGLIIGTPHYMSPEQVLDPDNIDARSDVFSLGILLYEMLTGDVPFGKLGGIDAMLKIAREDITPPIYLNPHIGDQANDICCAAIERERDDRFPSARALAEACREALESS